MALVLADRVQETSTTAGTGSITLDGAVTGFQSFAAVGDGNNTYYTIYEQGTNNWEVGIGTYTASGTTLSRDTIIASSNSGAIVTFGAGPKNVFVDMPSEMIGLGGSGQSIQVNQTTESQTYTLATGSWSNLSVKINQYINGSFDPNRSIFVPGLPLPSLSCYSFSASHRRSAWPRPPAPAVQPDRLQARPPRP